MTVKLEINNEDQNVEQNQTIKIKLCLLQTFLKTVEINLLIHQNFLIKLKKKKKLKKILHNKKIKLLFKKITKKKIKKIKKDISPSMSVDRILNKKEKILTKINKIKKVGDVRKRFINTERYRFVKFFSEIETIIADTILTFPKQIRTFSDFGEISNEMLEKNNMVINKNFFKKKKHNIYKNFIYEREEQN